MPIYKVLNNSFIKLTETSFEAENLYEVNNLQIYISNSIDVIDPNLLVISTEFSDWTDSRRSVDILCIDKEGNLVVVELKRTQGGGHMELQALRYSAMLANMKFDKAVKTYESYLEKIGVTADAEQELLKFLEWEEIQEEEFAQDVRIILISADFSIELTTTILWLNERDIDIKCVRIRLQKDNDTLYFDIQQIIPLPEAADYQVRLNEKAVEERFVRRERKREQSIVTKLFNSNKLKVGQKVLLKPAIDQGIDKELVTATITRSGRNCLQIKGDSKFYSFSSLRGKLINEHKLVDIRPDWGFNLRHDWTTEEGKTLNELDD